MYKVKNLFLFFLFLNAFSSKADIGIFDIATFSLEGELLYLKYESPSGLDEETMTYLNHKTKERYGVIEFLDKFYKSDKIEVYEQLDIINLEHVDTSITFEKELFILRKSKLIDYEELIKKYKIISVQEGNTFGFIHSEGLSELDNHWLENYPIQLLFSLPEFGACYLSFLGIEGNLTAEEVHALEKRAKLIVATEKEEEFKALLSELYRINIIMIGQCSC